jgi:hypothetical protein
LELLFFYLPQQCRTFRDILAVPDTESLPACREQQGFFRKVLAFWVDEPIKKLRVKIVTEVKIRHFSGKQNPN